MTRKNVMPAQAGIHAVQQNRTVTADKPNAQQPWIANAPYDLAFILSPALLTTLLVLLFRDTITQHPLTPALWAILVVGVDVGHVYSTLWRTYLDPAERRRRRTLLTLAPLLGWLAFACLYSLGPTIFWRALAYLAVLHFVRQQYGFMMIYARRQTTGRTLDKLAIYGATITPLVWWHTHPRHFAWFVDHDFLALDLPRLGTAAVLAYAAILAAYATKEVAETRRNGLNWPKNLLLAGTALSWFVGIVALDSDLAFTALNVLAHGIPYAALVWRHGRINPARPRVFTPTFLPLFLAIPLLLAYLEEGAWDGLVWADHPALFPGFDALPFVDDATILTLLVPLLALPQITHYILDAFIWRTKEDPTLRTMLA